MTPTAMGIWCISGLAKVPSTRRLFFKHVKGEYTSHQRLYEYHFANQSQLAPTPFPR